MKVLYALILTLVVITIIGTHSSCSIVITPLGPPAVPTISFNALLLGFLLMETF